MFLYYCAELTLSTDIINFKAAATRDENELSKLIVVCMHLTMVVKSSEMIQEKTMLNLSNEDQLVIKGILHAIVNDDQLTRARLTEILNEPSSGKLGSDFLNYLLGFREINSF